MGFGRPLASTYTCTNVHRAAGAWPDRSVAVDVSVASAPAKNIVNAGDNDTSMGGEVQTTELAHGFSLLFVTSLTSSNTLGRPSNTLGRPLGHTWPATRTDEPSKIPML